MINNPALRAVKMLLGNRPIRFKKYKVVVSELTHLGCSEWNECGGYRTRFQQGSCDDWQRPQLWQNVRTWWYRRAQWRGQICPACHSKCYRKVTCTSVPPIPLWEIIKMENQGPHLEWLNQKKKKNLRFNQLPEWFMCIPKGEKLLSTQGQVGPISLVLSISEFLGF